MNRQVRILGVTLARGGSKSVPMKNIRPIMGIALMAYTIGEALRSQLITRYVVSTDDEKIRETWRQASSLWQQAKSLGVVGRR